MFDKYSEKVSRALFFSRREAGEHGATSINTVHLLLGLSREDEELFIHVGGVTGVNNLVRTRLEASLTRKERIPNSVDLPLAEEYKDVLLQAADEAKMLSSNIIESHHLLLAILHMKECMAAKILVDTGITYVALRDAIANNP